MAKLFTTNEEIVHMIEQKFNDTSLPTYGVSLKIMSVTKAKDIFKISKASAATEFIAKKDGMVQLFVYETAFDRLPEDTQLMLIEMILSNIGYDIDKDKIIVETNPYKSVFAMRQKYGDVFMDKLETSYIVIEQIEEEEKERKMAEKENKKNNKNQNFN